MKMLYEILKTSKLGASFAPDMYTALWAQKLARDGEVKTLSGIPPLTFPSNGQPLLDLLISGNEEHNGTPTPDNPVMPVGTGDLETIGTKAGQYKIPISSASTTTPVYLGEVQATRRVKKLVLTGEEEWALAGNVFYITSVSPDYRRMAGEITYICSHFPVSKQVGSATYVESNTLAFGSSIYSQRIYCTYTGVSTVNDFKSYLATQYAAGTPVTVWYVLATEETAVVNEPLMKVGDYADTVSMEQAGVEIPTVRGTNTLDVLTDVKPSEIYIKYKS
jgi:hypothetical protein